MGYMPSVVLLTLGLFAFGITIAGVAGHYGRCPRTPMPVRDAVIILMGSLILAVVLAVRP